MVWCLDRWGRSLPDPVATLRELTELGMGFVSLTEALGERVRAGSAQARKAGRPHGRPRTASLKAAGVIRLKSERVRHSEIARRLGIGPTSVRRILTEGRIDSPSDRR